MSMADSWRLNLSVNDEIDRAKRRQSPQAGHRGMRQSIHRLVECDHHRGSELRSVQKSGLPALKVVGKAYNDREAHSGFGNRCNNMAAASYESL